MIQIEILQVVGMGLVATFLVLLVKEHNENIALLLTIFVSGAMFLFLVDKISEVIRMIERIAISANVNIIYIETILKIIGIAYIAEFATQISKDAGQSAIASKIELGGKIIILAMAIPIMTTIIDTVIGLIPKW